VTGSIVLSSSEKVVIPFRQPQLDELNYVLFTKNENISFPLTHSSQLWSHPSFDVQKKVVIIVTGWNSNIEEENSAANALWEAFRSRGDSNFILIDTAKHVDTLYTWSALNTVELGAGLGQGLSSLATFVDINNIYLIGHSLGAHIAGAAGRTFEEITGRLLPRITGLDPAKVV
jgi:pimeloyl-ACP methyl ester carboxylesterase